MDFKKIIFYTLCLLTVVFQEMLYSCYIKIPLQINSILIFPNYRLTGVAVPAMLRVIVTESGIIA